MSKVTFRKAMESADSASKIVQAYADEVSSSAAFACAELDKIKVLRNSESNTFGNFEIVKVAIKPNSYVNIAVTFENSNIQSKEVFDSFRYRVHTIYYVGAEGFSSVDSDGEIEELKITKLAGKVESDISKYFYDLSIEDREKKVMHNSTDYDSIGYEINKIYNDDCMAGMSKMGYSCVDFVLTDIPYDGVNDCGDRSTQEDGTALRLINKGEADIITFELKPFLDEIYRIGSNTFCIFCGMGQFSEIYEYFRTHDCTVRALIWEKTNPSPMNGEYNYLSGIEMAVWARKKSNGVFNAFCKNTVFRYSSGTREIHPTQKNVELFEELIKDNTYEDMLVFDPCMGSGTTAVAALNQNRNFIGFEKSPEYFKSCTDRVNKIIM